MRGIFKDYYHHICPTATRKTLSEELSDALVGRLEAFTVRKVRRFVEDVQFQTGGYLNYNVRHPHSNHNSAELALQFVLSIEMCSQLHILSQNKEFSFTSYPRKAVDVGGRFQT